MLWKKLLRALQFLIHPFRNPRPVQKPCFMRLPAEIRNRIYEYALGNNSGTLEYNLHSPNDAQLNQLRYVSRQLHNETSHIELKVNQSVNFVGALGDGPTATQLFLRCFKKSPKREAWLDTQCAVIKSGAGRSHE
jgi:hypothetical protein